MYPKIVRIKQMKNSACEIEIRITSMEKENPVLYVCKRKVKNAYGAAAMAEANAKRRDENCKQDFTKNFASGSHFFPESRILSVFPKINGERTEMTRYTIVRYLSSPQIILFGANFCG